MRRHGLVKSVRGPGGGYQLGLDQQEISIGMIIAAVNENITVTRCQGQASCQGGKECLTHSLWEQLSQRIEGFLNEITVSELVTQQQHRRKNKRTHRHQDFENLVVVNQ